MLNCTAINSNSSYPEVVKEACHTQRCLFLFSHPHSIKNTFNGQDTPLPHPPNTDCPNITSETECLLLDFCSYSTAVLPSCYEKDTVIPHCARRSSVWHPECSVCETGYLPSMNGLKCCRGPQRCTRCNITTGACTHCYGGFIAVAGLCVRCPNNTWSDGNVSACRPCAVGEHCARCDARTGRCAECAPGFDLAHACSTRTLPLLWWVYALVIPLVGVPLIVVVFVLFYRRYQRHQKDKEQNALRQHREQQQQQKDGENNTLSKPLLSPSSNPQ